MNKDYWKCPNQYYSGSVCHLSTVANKKMMSDKRDKPNQLEKKEKLILPFFHKF